MAKKLERRILEAADRVVTLTNASAHEIARFPCVGNVGVGDMEEILEGKRVGVALRECTPAEYHRAVECMFALLGEPDIGERCVETARELFSLEMGVDAYRNIYLSLGGHDSSVRIDERRDLNCHRLDLTEKEWALVAPLSRAGATGPCRSARGS